MRRIKQSRDLSLDSHGAVPWPFFKTALIAIVLFAPACSPVAQPQAKPMVGWVRLGSWSGRGDSQSDSFISDTGQLRVKWETKQETPPGAGKFKVTVHSAISGRPLQLAAEHNGVGHDVAYINEDPRMFHLVIESANLDWTVSVEEGVLVEK